MGVLCTPTYPTYTNDVQPPIVLCMCLLAHHIPPKRMVVMFLRNPLRNLTVRMKMILRGFGFKRTFNCIILIASHNKKDGYGL